MSQAAERSVDRIVAAEGRPIVDEESGRTTDGSSRRDSVRSQFACSGPGRSRSCGTASSSTRGRGAAWRSELATMRRLVIITGPGHGASGDPGRRYTLDECAEAAGTILDTLGIRAPVDWVGNAWGGHVGIDFRAPMAGTMSNHRDSGNPDPVPESDGADPHEQPALGVSAARPGRLHPQRRGRHPPVAQDARTGSGRRRPGRGLPDTRRPRGLRNAVASISLQRPDLTNRLPEVSVPTLFVTGSDHQVGHRSRPARRASCWRMVRRPS